MQLDKDKIKESLTEDEIHTILKDLGSKDPLQGNQFQTVCHGGHKHKLYYYHESKSFHCYTDCSTNMDIFEVVVRAKKVSFPQAIHYVANLTGKTFGFSMNVNNHSQEEKIDDWNWLNKFQKKEKVNTTLPTYDERVLELFSKLPHEEWINDGISIETMEEFEIGYYMKQDCITINHRNLQNELVGIRGRMLSEEMVNDGRKYMPLTIENRLYNHMTMMNLYGLNKTQNAVKNLKKIVLYEGEKSVLKSNDFYGEFNFTCAVCSSNISNYHRDIILSLGVEEVFIAFDKFRDREENETEESYLSKIIDYQERLIKLSKKFTSYCRVYVLWDNENVLDYKMSPCDMGKEILEQLMKSKIEITTSGVDK